MIEILCQEAYIGDNKITSDSTMLRLYLDDDEYGEDEIIVNVISKQTEKQIVNLRLDPDEARAIGSVLINYADRKAVRRYKEMVRDDH